MPVLHSPSPDATERYGSALGRVLRSGDVLVLEGPLGAGKTCLVRGIVVGAGGDAAAVRSPTFVLHQPHRAAALTVHHVDLYRLGPGASVEVLDFDAMLDAGAVVVEWGGYADLSSLAPTVVSIDAEETAPSERVLRMAEGAAEHLERAWTSLLQRTAAS